MCYSEKSHQQDKAETLQNVIQWYPQNKIEIARRKLDKQNPASKFKAVIFDNISTT